MSAVPQFSDNYFELFDLPAGFDLDSGQLGERYRRLQGELHPDRYASASAHEQRLAVQYSALVNEAYDTLRRPLARALYLLRMAGMSEEEVTGQQVDGGFLMMQMELREKLEAIPGMVDPHESLDHLVTEIRSDLGQEKRVFADAHAAGDLSGAARACVRMQYLDKLLREAEQLETELMDT